MGLYRKRPVIVEAEQFVIWDTKKPPPFITILGITFPVNKDCTIVVPTLEGQHIASNLDWIIRGVKGEVYPCKPDVFDATYMVAEACEPVTITPPDLMSDKIPEYPIHEFVRSDKTTSATKCQLCGLESWQHYKINFNK